MNLAMLISDTLRYGPRAILVHADVAIRKALVDRHVRAINRRTPREHFTVHEYRPDGDHVERAMTQEEYEKMTR